MLVSNHVRCIELGNEAKSTLVSMQVIEDSNHVMYVNIMVVTISAQYQASY